MEEKKKTEATDDTARRIRIFFSDDAFSMAIRSRTE